MVEAAKDLVLVLVDCTKKGKNEGLKKKYGIRGYPTVVFCDPKGKAVGRLGRDRSSKAVAKEFKKFAQKHGWRPKWDRYCIFQARSLFTNLKCGRADWTRCMIGI